MSDAAKMTISILVKYQSRHRPQKEIKLDCAKVKIFGGEKKSRLVLTEKKSKSFSNVFIIHFIHLRTKENKKGETIGSKSSRNVSNVKISCYELKQNAF